MAFLLHPDGMWDEVEPANGRSFTLEELRDFIGGGYIEVQACRAKPGFILVVDEDGKGKGLPWNEAATILLGIPGDPVVGRALVCEDGEVE